MPFLGMPAGRCGVPRLPFHGRPLPELRPVGGRLAGREFFRVRFEECKIAGAGFAETTLQHVVFGHCKGEFVNFSRSRLRSVRFAGTQLRGGFFDGCRFERVVFSQCGLVTADFSGTRLAGISFADSDIRGIRLREVVSPEL